MLRRPRIDITGLASSPTPRLTWRSGESPSAELDDSAPQASLEVVPVDVG
jgi:hypothetical protein